MHNSEARRRKERQKEQIKQRYNVVIDPENYEYIPAKKQADYYDNDVNQRVAIYVRVSTDDVRQTTSYELQMLSRVLRLCAGTWEGDENSFSANILNGITRLVYTFGNQLNDEVFKERVGALSIKQLVRMSKERCPGSMGYAEAMLLEYNGKKKNISQRLSMNKLHMQGTAGLCSLLSDVDTSSEAATAEGVSE